MSVEEIRRSWEFNRRQGLTTNINCGYLRRCGKGQFLRAIILEEALKEENKNKTFYILTTNRNNSREYTDLVDQNRVINVNHIIVRNIIAAHNGTSLYQLRGLTNSNCLFFSDEFPNIEEIINPMRLTLFAGVYSIQNTVYNIPTHFIPDHLGPATPSASVEYLYNENRKNDSDLEVKEPETIKNTKFNFIIDSWKE